MEKRAKFSPGDLIRHRLFEYRGAIFDVDAEFSGDDEWYEEVAKSRPPKDAPWYHVLPDGKNHTTYVAEQNLMPDPEPCPIEHPYVTIVFREYTNGRYRPSELTN